MAFDLINVYGGYKLMQNLFQIRRYQKYQTSSASSWAIGPIEKVVLVTESLLEGNNPWSIDDTNFVPIMISFSTRFLD